MIGFNDSEGNSGSTLEQSFFVNDTTAPSYTEPIQTSDTPEYDENNTVSITVQFYSIMRTIRGLGSGLMLQVPVIIHF
jgi:hypothetical protein